MPGGNYSLPALFEEYELGVEVVGVFLASLPLCWLCDERGTMGGRIGHLFCDAHAKKHRGPLADLPYASLVRWHLRQQHGFDTGTQPLTGSK